MFSECEAYARMSGEDQLKTRSGRVSRPVNKQYKQDCIMDFAKIEKCRAKKKKQLMNNKLYTKKKDKKKGMGKTKKKKMD